MATVAKLPAQDADTSDAAPLDDAGREALRRACAIVDALEMSAVPTHGYECSYSGPWRPLHTFHTMIETLQGDLHFIRDHVERFSPSTRQGR